MIKEWFINNNVRINDDSKLDILCLYVKAYFLKINSSLDFSVKVEDGKIITTDLTESLNEEELLCLKKINNFLGYKPYNVLLMQEPILLIKSLKEITNEDINNCFKNSLELIDELYVDYDFDKEIFINNEYTFFIDKRANLKEDEYEYLKSITHVHKKEYEVNRIDGKLMVS